MAAGHLIQSPAQSRVSCSLILPKKPLIIPSELSYQNHRELFSNLITMIN